MVGVLEGAGPLADETIVVGAHYDHLGHGGLLSGSLAFLSKDIHNGADDNASGTAMVIELARRLAKRADPLPRRVVFIAFSGEERGLLGSAALRRAPALSARQSTAMMFNFDMVGRLNEQKRADRLRDRDDPRHRQPWSTPWASPRASRSRRSADGLRRRATSSRSTSRTSPSCSPSPGRTATTTGPATTPSGSTSQGMARIADFAELLAPRPGPPPRAPGVRQGRPQGGPRRCRPGPGRGLGLPRLDPVYDDENKGVKLSGVREGSPAEKGGLKGGDVIVGFGGKPVATIYDYTESLGRYKPGDTVESSSSATARRRSSRSPWARSPPSERASRHC